MHFHPLSGPCFVVPDSNDRSSKPGIASSHSSAAVADAQTCSSASLWNILVFQGGAENGENEMTEMEKLLARQPPTATIY